MKFGGDEGIRTLDPYVANVVLSQLSYIPVPVKLREQELPRSLTIVS